jgi:Asp-tRNA(Asn)/Glu-tRNA(Gln) amidotransferase A subunit family amidase
MNNTKSPLAGARFAVMDLFDIEGLRLTVGCRAWYDLSRPAQATASALQILLDGGANLLGTLKLGSLITREEPPESADYFAAFNPRGDGYQSAWSSSGGSGASLASYDWLDFTLGTDSQYYISCLHQDMR